MCINKCVTYVDTGGCLSAQVVLVYRNILNYSEGFAGLQASFYLEREKLGEIRKLWNREGRYMHKMMPLWEAGIWVVFAKKKCIDLEKANHFINNAVVGLSLISSIYTSTPTSGEENSESIFLQMCKVQKPFSCCEKQYWRQAEHNSFHIFPHFQNGQGTSQEAQNTLGRSRHCKFTKNVYHRVMARLWVSVVKHRTESVKISPWSLFSSQHVELRTPIPIITKSHAWSALHIACAPLLCLQIHLPLAQIPFFLVQHCSTSTLQLEESSCIFTLLWASSAKLPDYL